MCLTDDGPLSPFQGRSSTSGASSFHTSVLQAIDGVMSLALCPRSVRTSQSVTQPCCVLQKLEPFLTNYYTIAYPPPPLSVFFWGGGCFFVCLFVWVLLCCVSVLLLLLLLLLFWGGSSFFFFFLFIFSLFLFYFFKVCQSVLTTTFVVCPRDAGALPDQLLHGGVPLAPSFL